MVYVLATTRFNETTWDENVSWRRQHDWEGCIYGTSKRMGGTIPPEVDVIVLEMHNDENRIKGVGLVRNKVYTRERHRIYRSDPNYNRYIYLGHARIDRDELDADEEKIMGVLDLAVFKGATHLKRGHGIIRIPKNIVDTKCMNLPGFFETMFRCREDK